VDTLRADALGCYGYPLPTSPNIDQLAAESILFANTFAQSSWTKPATASLVTGLNPASHGAVNLTSRISPDATTLAEVLRAHGYLAGAFVTNVNVSGEFGFKRGFDEYNYLPEDLSRSTLHVTAAKVNELVFPWLETHQRQPFFLYLHVSDPHAPYRPPSLTAERFRPPGPVPTIAYAPSPLHELTKDSTARTTENIAYVRSLYDGDVSLVDDAFGALVTKLKSLGLYDKLVMVVTSDHGEEFNEHGGFEHGHTLYREMLSVPLILRLPGGQGGGTRVLELARQIDIAPTVLRSVGLRVPPAMQGRSLWPVPAASTAPADAISQTKLGGGDVAAAMTTEWKVIHRGRATTSDFEIYDLRQDPEERRNLAAEKPVLLGYGRQLLMTSAANPTRPRYDGAGNLALEPETAAKLRALGYVNR
jgi:arylsulfatase A-like enzyme